MTFCSIVVCLVMTSQGYGEDTKVMKIINKMKEVHESSQEMAQKIEIHIKSEGKTVSKLIAGKAQKQMLTGKHVLLVLLEPEVTKGFAFLFKEKDGMMIDIWVYPPAINRIRRLSIPRNAYDSFLNTDFTYLDLGLLDKEVKYRFIMEEDVEGMTTYKVEQTFISPIRYYSKIIIWISKETYLPIRKDFYDITDRLYKRQLFENIIMVGETPVPYKITMENLHLNSSTVILVKKLKAGLDLELPDNIFKPERLIYSLTCPIWERVCYESERKRKE